MTTGRAEQLFYVVHAAGCLTRPNGRVRMPAPRMESDRGQIQIDSNPYHSSTIGRPASHEEICGRLWATPVHGLAGGP